MAKAPNSGSSADFVIHLEAAPWSGEIERGEAGIQQEWIIVDERDGGQVGKLVLWTNGEYGMWVGHPAGHRVVLPKGFGEVYR